MQGIRQICTLSFVVYVHLQLRAHGFRIVALFKVRCMLVYLAAFHYTVYTCTCIVNLGRATCPPNRPTLSTHSITGSLDFTPGIMVSLKCKYVSIQ